MCFALNGKQKLISSNNHSNTDIQHCKEAEESCKNES